MIYLEEKVNKIDNILIYVGQYIREKRLLAGMTQEALAEVSGLQANYITSVETGRRNISLTTLYRLLNALEINFEDLLNANTINPSQNKILNNHLRLLSLRNDDEINTIHRISKEVINTIDRTRNELKQ